MNFDVVIGIETHIQLATQSKMFCSCKADSWQEAPNTHTCPVCLGLPGALPTINKFALEQAMLMGLALQAKVAPKTHFDRKNYFYPDLAKGYQISQFDEPLNVGGWVEVDGQKIELIRAHLEEDVGKMTHGHPGSLVDFNKGGTPLLEIVSGPVLTSAAQARSYVQTLRQLARYLQVSDGNLEQGSLRADINISLQVPHSWALDGLEIIAVDGATLNPRTEVKNVNSFKSIERAVEYEIKRQTELLSNNQALVQETRGWDEAKGKTTSQRSKEEAHDYRYFPEPDLPPLVIDEAWVEEIRRRLPELPLAKRQRFMSDYGLNEREAVALVEDRGVADWYEAALQSFSSSETASVDEAKTVANWMLGEVSRLQNDHLTLVTESKLTATELAATLLLVQAGTISAASGKEVIAELFVNGGTATAIVESKGLGQVGSADDLEPVIKAVIAANPDVVEKIKAGKTASMQFLVGQVMKETRGRAKPDVVQQLLERLLA